MTTSDQDQPNKLETLFGGRMVSVIHEDSSTEEVKVHQIRVSDFERAYSLLNDDIAFVALACAQKKEWVLTLRPESFVALQSAVQEVNAKGFFTYCEGRKKREQRQTEGMFAALAHLPPDLMKLAVETGSRSTSPT